MDANADLTPYLSDAAHFPGGHAAGLAVPRGTAEIQDLVRAARTILPIGAQSSLTGGATPMGEVVLSTRKLTRVLDAGPSRIRVEAGVTVAVIQETLAAHGAWFPPTPTFTGALAEASSRRTRPARRRSGTARAPWVEELTVKLADGFELTVRAARRARGHRLSVPTARRRRRRS